MNDDIKNFLTSYQSMIETYKPKISPDSEKLASALKYLDEISGLAEGFSDIGSFLTKANEIGFMNKMTVFLSDIATESLKAQQASGTMKEPSVSDAALGYHKSFEAIAEKEKCPETCKEYERIFQHEKESSHAGEFVRRLAEEGLFMKMSSAPLIEMMRPLVGGADKLSLPSMAFHNEQMLAAAEKSKSSTEIEYESNRLLELNRMELMLDNLLNSDLFYTLGNATSSYLLSPTEENRERVENSYRFVSEFFGIDDKELFAVPRVIDLIEKIILPMLNKEGKRFTLEGFVKEQCDVIAHCIKDKAPVVKGSASRKNAVLWSKHIPLDAILDALRKPVRPEELSV